MRSNVFILAAAIAVTLVPVLSGCGGDDWGYLEGTVKLNGESVGPGTIYLTPADDSRAGAVATFGEDGTYSIISAGRKPGAPPGEYRVTIRGGENLTAETAAPPPETKIPPRYGTPAGSNLTVTIEPGDNTRDFDLEP
jgi:hypothetical protein